VADPAYSFGVLGPLLVERDGQSLFVASGHQRTLLALLLASDQPIARDRLIDELWGESPPPTAAKALSVFLSRMRAQLGEVIVFSGGAYRLEAGDFELDANRLRTLLLRARAEPANRRDLLAEALALFRGEPLADVDSDGLVARWRRTLELERLEAMIARIDADLDEGVGSELVVELDGLLDANPYEERIWGQLMVALARSGRQADALETYQRVRRLLAYELGIEPGQPLARIHAAILDGGDGWLSGAAPTVVEPDAAAAGGSLGAAAVPRPLGALIGREGELSELSGLLEDRRLRLLTLVGAGGVGKTRLALELAHRLQRSFEDGAAFVDLGQLGDARLLTTEIAAALGARDGVAPPPVERLGQAIAGRELLLVLDNFEHLLPAASELAELLAAAPGVQVIVTSRAPLRIRGEQLFEVEPLELPVDEVAATASASPAIELFLERGRAIDRRLQADPASMRLIASICRRVEGLPLGIELAAAQLRVLTLAQLELSLQRPLNPGAQVPRDLPDRQQTLEQTIRWSFNLLTPGARELLLAAGVFRGGFRIEALAAVVGRAPQTDLGELLDASLVRREGDAPRFGMLELVRAFVAAELEANGTRAELLARHRAYFCRIADAVGAELHDGDPRGSLADQLRPEYANLRAALDDAFASGDRDSALGLVRGTRALWYSGWLVQEGQALIGRLLDQFEVDPEDELLLLRSASFLDGVSAGSPTRGVFTELLARRAEELGDLSALAIGVANLAALAQNDQDRERVSALKPRLAQLIDADLPARIRAFVSYALAVCDYLDGDLPRACDRAADAVRLSAEADHAYTVAATTMLQLMLCSIRDGELRRADLTAGFATMKLAPIRPLAPLALWLVARYAAAVDRDAAIRWLSEAERIYRGLDAKMWPESDVRDETMRVLGLTSIPPAVSPETDYLVTLAAAADWLDARVPDEVAKL
jgi:predicted ATPase/DNA-binding SARP family transcriptional activator